MGKWKSHDQSEMQVFQCLGHSKWTICSRLSQFCCSNFPNFSLLSCEANSYHPRHGEGRKWENQNLPTWVRCRFFSAWGNQTTVTREHREPRIPEVLFLRVGGTANRECPPRPSPSLPPSPCSSLSRRTQSTLFHCPTIVNKSTVLT